MYPARNGDAFLVEDDRTTIMIDGGYVTTFNDSLLSDLRTRAAEGKAIDLLVSTHIDADHISGLIKLLAQNGHSVSPTIIRIRHVWHNSLGSLALPGLRDPELSQGDKEILQNIRHRGFAADSAPAMAQEDISALQGSSLAAYLRGGEYCWNFGEGRQAIASPLQLKLNDNAAVIVLGPSPERLIDLRDWWIRQLQEYGFSGNIEPNPLMYDAFEFLCSYESGSGRSPIGEISHSSGDRTLADIYVPDDSVTNGSSISLIIEIGGRRFLFLGDASAEDVVDALMLRGDASLPVEFDAIKVSHHGSARNTSPFLLNLVDSPRYLISSNGERHGHPDVEVLRAIVDRPASYCRELFFNFSTPASQLMQTYKSASNSRFVVHEAARQIDMP